jgi:hypothetical protein
MKKEPNKPPQTSGCVKPARRPLPRSKWSGERIRRGIRLIGGALKIILNNNL